MMKTVQATALLVAFVLTVIFQHPASARSYPCWMVRWYVNGHTRAEVEAMARQHKVSRHERAAAAACLKG